MTQIVYDVKELFDRLERKLDRFLEGMGDKAEKRELEQLEGRVGKLETWVTGWKAILAVLLILVTVFGLPAVNHFLR